MRAGNIVVVLLVIAAAAQGVLLLQRYRSAPTTPPPAKQVLLGDTLESVSVHQQVEGVDSSEGLELSSLVGSDCVAIIFYDPACPGCAKLAAIWDSAQMSATELHDEAIWISVRPQLSSDEVLQGQGLSSRYSLANVADAMKLGIRSVPQGYMIGPGNVLTATEVLLPREVTRERAACKSGRWPPGAP